MHDLLCRHTDDMIHKLESAGLGYHVKTDESDDRLGMNSSSSRFVSGLVIVREFSDLYSVCENMNGWWVHFWQKYIYEKHGICHSLIYKKAKFNLKMRTQCQLCLPTKRKELCFFFHRPYSVTSSGVSRACPSRKYAPSDLGFRSAESPSRKPLHKSDCQSLCEYLKGVITLSITG